MRKYSYSFYIILKAIADSIILVSALNKWTAYMFDVNFDSWWALSCLARLYVCFSLSLWEMLLILLISLDRLLKIMYPNRFESVRKWQTKSILVMLMLIYSFAVNIILPLNTSYEILHPKSVCILSFNVIKSHSWIFVGHILFLIFCLNNAVNIRLIEATSCQPWFKQLDKSKYVVKRPEVCNHLYWH